MIRAKHSEPIFMLVGNKFDKTHEREVTEEEGAALARSFGCAFVETSAKTGDNVEHLFTCLVRNLRNPQRNLQPPSSLQLALQKSEKTAKSRKCYIF